MHPKVFNVHSRVWPSESSLQVYCAALYRHSGVLMFVMSCSDAGTVRRDGAQSINADGCSRRRKDIPERKPSKFAQMNGCECIQRFSTSTAGSGLRNRRCRHTVWPTKRFSLLRLSEQRGPGRECITIGRKTRRTPSGRYVARKAPYRHERTR